MTLSSLAPRRGELLWDIGAGSGSVAIEWMLADPSHARHRDRGATPSAPRASAATPPPSACRTSRSWKARRRRRSTGSPPPDAIFIGGGGGDPGVLEAAIAALRSGGRLVVNAVTLETEALLHRPAHNARRRADAHRDRARRSARRT